MSQPPMAMVETPRSRLSAIQFNVRGLLRNPITSSIYSRSVNASAAPSPRVPPLPYLPPLAFLRRQDVGQDEESRPVLQHVDTHNRYDSTNTLPLDGQEFSRDGSPVSQISMWHGHNEPITVALGRQSPRDERPLVPEEEVDQAVAWQQVNDLTGQGEREAVDNVRHKRRKRHCKHCRKGRGAWLKHRHHRQNLWKGRTRVKAVGAVISGIVLVVLLIAYLSIALTQSDIGKEIHVLFIISILAVTIFCAHCVIRLCMLVRKGRRPRHHRHNRTLGILEPESFQPDAPLQVHVAADEEAVHDNCHVEGDLEAALPDVADDKPLKVPPPAYGLWRSSVRINPNLLHWARVQQPPTPRNPFATPHMGHSTHNSPEMQQREAEPQAPRPPSYVSDDGVTYVVQAQPRSTLLMPDLRPPSAMHPAMRADLREADGRSDDGVGTIAIGLGFDERGP